MPSELIKGRYALKSLFFDQATANQLAQLNLRIGCVSLELALEKWNIQATFNRTAPFTLPERKTKIIKKSPSYLKEKEGIELQNGRKCPNL